MGEIQATETPLRDGRHLIIRTAVQDDAFATLELYRSVIAEGRYTLLEPDELKRDEKGEKASIAADLENPNWLCIVAEVDDRIVGMAKVRGGVLKRTSHFGEVDSVWVYADERKMGIGTVLMNAIVSWSVSNQTIEKLGLFVFSTNEAAIRLYERSGFVIEGRAPKDIKLGDGDYAGTVIMGRMTDD